jgi:hypothetical protein
MVGNKVNRESVRWLFLEGTAIILSILLAFAIDAWWAERKQGIEETEILLGLQKEFVLNREALEGSLERHARGLSLLADLLIATDRGAWTATGTTIDEALLELTNPPTTDLGSGVLNALVSAGRIEVLSSRVLREKIASWEGVFDEVRDDEVNNRNLVFDRVIPYLMRWGVRLGDSLNYSLDDWPIPPRSVADDADALSRLLSDPEFASIVEIRYGFKTHATGEYELAIAAIDEILNEIDQSLAM